MAEKNLFRSRSLVLVLAVWYYSTEQGKGQYCEYRDTTVHQEIPRSSCTDVLESAFVGSTVNCSGSFCAVEISEGHYFLSGILTIKDIELSLIGVGRGGNISCDRDGLLSSRLLFTNTNLLFHNLHFRNCPNPISIQEVDSLEIRSCSFKYFSEAVMDIFNCRHVLISDCVFEHNRGSGLSNSSNRGNTGCIAIGFNDVSPSVGNISIEIRNSNFSNNFASVKESNGTSVINLLGGNVYKGRGGAVGMFFDNIDVRALISGCLFENNEALYGAGVYIAYGGSPGKVHHKTTIVNCTFTENRAKFGGGGVLAAFRISGDNENPMIAEVIDSNFTRNEAVNVAGGVGFTIADRRTGEGVQGRLQGCIFADNKARVFGSAARFTIINLLLESSPSQSSVHEVIDCTFIGNVASSGALGVANVPLLLSGSIAFTNNTGPSLQVISSLVTIDGDIRFVGNDARRDGGGALLLSSSGQILMKTHSRMEFHNNLGSTGSAIVVSGQRIPLTYSEVLFNPQCFLLYEDISAAPNNWTNVSIFFKGNSAEVGADIYATSLESCAWFSFESPYFSIPAIQEWTVFHNSVSSIQTDQVKLQSKEVQSFYAGHPSKINLIPLDQFEKETVGAFQLIDSSNISVGIQSEPSVLVASLNKSIDVTFTLMSERDLDINKTLEVVDLEQRKLGSVDVTTSGCPPGQLLQPKPLTNETYECQCDVSQSHIVLCKDDENKVILQLGFWSVYAEHILHGYSCPPGYCRCNDATDFSNRACYPSYDIAEPEKQCVCGRRGILCGRCSNSSNGGLTSLYLHCEDRCHPAWWTIFPIAGLLAAAVVGFIVFLNIKLPSWLMPILLYIRMASYYGYYFPPTFEKVGRYLYFLSSLLSLYFPYDFCIPGANALGVFAARFMPLFVAVIVWPIAWMLNKKWKGVYHWEGSITLAFLLFSHVIHTALQILNCPMIYNTSNELTPRWYHGGEQKCFRGAHIPLGLLALAVLVAFVALCVLLAITVSKRVEARWVEKLRMVFVTEFFREKYTWWIVVEAVERFSLVVILVIFPRSMIVPLVLLAVLLCAYGYCKPFKDWFANYLSVFLLAALFLLIILSSNRLLIENLLTLVTEGFDDDCPREELSGITELSLVLIPFYYLPVLVSMVAIGCYLVAKKKMVRTYSVSQKARDIRPQSSASEQFVTEFEVVAVSDDED